MFFARPPHVPYGLKDLVKYHIPEDRIDEFARWAFGPDYLEIEQLINFARAWNKLHEDEFKIDYSNSITMDVIRMTEIWKEKEGL